MNVLAHNETSFALQAALLARVISERQFNSLAEAQNLIWRAQQMRDYHRARVNTILTANYDERLQSEAPRHRWQSIYPGASGPKTANAEEKDEGDIIDFMNLAPRLFPQLMGATKPFRGIAHAFTGTGWIIATDLEEHKRTANFQICIGCLDLVKDPYALLPMFVRKGHLCTCCSLLHQRNQNEQTDKGLDTKRDTFGKEE